LRGGHDRGNAPDRSEAAQARKATRSSSATPIASALDTQPPWVRVIPQSSSGCVTESSPVSGARGAGASGSMLPTGGAVVARTAGGEARAAGGVTYAHTARG